MISLLLGVCVIVLWTSLSRLRARTRALENERDRTAQHLSSTIAALNQRLSRLEGAPRAAAPVPPAAPPAAPVERVDAAVPALAPAAPAVAAVPATTETAPPVPVLPPAASAPARHREPEDTVPRAADPPPAASPAPTPSATASTGAGDTATWEVVVGTSWLNKIGVTVFVTGLALLLGYSVTHVGPVGRVALGFAAAGTMLALGVAVERRALYRAFGRGLIAGGWAGLYVTTYAMHAVPAARLVESDLAAGALLLLVAAGMVWHSLRYRSQTVTALAYIAAYIPLALTPLSTFSLVASLPLAVSLLVVSQRFGWSALALLGLASTYGFFALRETRASALPGTPSMLPYAVLAAYWLTFEAGDILWLRASSEEDRRRAGASLFATNAVGAMGCLLLLLPSDDSAFGAVVLGAAGLAYVASALIRARLVPGTAAPGDPATRFTTTHAASALAAAFFARAIGLQFHGPRASAAWLLETELLVATGLSLGDRQLRRIALGVAAITTWYTFVGGLGDPATVAWPWETSRWTPVAALIAVAWYGNREWIRQRQAHPDPFEHLYSWVASAAVGLVIWREAPVAYVGVLGLAAAIALLEAGIRRAAEYRAQSYVALVLSARVLFSVYALSGEPRTRDVWFALAGAVSLLYYATWRIQRAAFDAAERTPAAATTAAVGTALLALLEWHVSSPVWIGAVWMTTAAALAGVGAWKRLPPARWLGYVLSVLAGTRTAVLLLVSAPAGWPAIVNAGIVVAALWAIGGVGRRASDEEGGPHAELESVVAGLLAFGATPLLALVTWRALPADDVAVGWAASAVVFALLGHRRARAGQRWQAYGLACIAMLRETDTIRLYALRAAGAISPFSWPAAAALGVLAAAYVVVLLGRRAQTAAGSPSAMPERAATVALTILATLVVLNVEAVLFDRLTIHGAWSLTGAALLLAGFAANALDLRVEGYVVMALAALRSAAELLAVGSPSLLAPTLVIGSLYAASLGSRAALRARLASRTAAQWESGARIALSAAASGVLTLLVADRLSADVVTMGWGIEGIALLAAGFTARERVLRLAGLGVLFVCICKLFLYDLRELEALGRILSFVVLGLVLLGVSWIYTRFGEQIRKIL
jgi:Predicted membrane protein (DUF2339)